MGRQSSSRQAVADAYTAAFVDALKLPASTGRIFAALALSATPLSQAQLRSELALSEGSISEGLQLLSGEGLIERAGNPRARPAFFQLRPGSWAHNVSALLDNIQRSHEIALLTVRHLEDHGIDGPSREWATSLLALYEVLADEIPPVVQKALDAGEAARPRRRKRAAGA